MPHSILWGELTQAAQDFHHHTNPNQYMHFCLALFHSINAEKSTTPQKQMLQSPHERTILHTRDTDKFTQAKRNRRTKELTDTGIASQQPRNTQRAALQDRKGRRGRNSDHGMLRIHTARHIQCHPPRPWCRKVRNSVASPSEELQFPLVPPALFGSRFCTDLAGGVARATHCVTSVYILPHAPALSASTTSAPAPGWLDHEGIP